MQAQDQYSNVFPTNFDQINLSSMMRGPLPMMGGFMPSYQPVVASQPPIHTSPVPLSTAKGKERFVELDDKAWESQFAKLTSSSNHAELVNALAQVPESFQDDQGDMEAARGDEETDAEFMAKLENSWKNFKDTLDTSNLNDQELAAWEAQYGTNFGDLHGSDFDYNDQAQPAGYDPGAFDQWLHDATSKPYPFTAEQDNPFFDAFDPFAEGQRLLQEGHPLSEAALAFEAACKQNEHRGEAWRALGDTLAADEKEIKAIKALEQVSPPRSVRIIADIVSM